MRIGRVRLIPLLFSLGLGATASVGAMLLHVPAFYVRSAEPPGDERVAASNEFLVKEFFQFATDFKSGKGPWSFAFTQKQLNSFFAEHFEKHGDADNFRKIGISNPRVELGTDEVHLGFRYGEGTWSTVLTYDLKLWLAQSEVNALVIEVRRRRAGALSIPSQHVFQELTELGKKHNIDITWYRHEGNPVAVVKFQSDRQRPTAQLRRLEVVPGKITVQGVSFDPVPTSMEEPIKPPTASATKRP